MRLSAGRVEGAPVRLLPDHVDTGYAARLDRQTGAICITAPPSGS